MQSVMYDTYEEKHQTKPSNRVKRKLRLK